MKKYTNKILIIAIAVFLAAITVLFFINANEIKKQVEKSESNELSIEHK